MEGMDLQLGRLKAAIEEAHRIYGLDQQEEEKKLTPEDKAKIDAFDKFRGK